MAAYASFTVNGYYALNKGLTIGQALSRGYLSFTGNGFPVGGQECTQFYSGYLNTDIPADLAENSAECPDRSDPKTHCIQFHEKWKEPTWDSFTIPEIIDGHEVKYCFLTVHPLYANTPVWNEIDAQNCGPVYRDVLGSILCLRFRDENDNLHFSPVLNSIYNFNFVSRQNLVVLNPDVTVYDPETGTFGPQRIDWNTRGVCELCLGSFCAYDIVTEEYFGTPYTNVIINLNGLRFYEDYTEGDPELMAFNPETTDEFDISNKMSKILQLGKAELNTLFEDVLFNNDPNVTAAVLDGLKLYGQNPSDLIIDLCQLPFSPSAAKLCGVGGAQQNITIGSYGPTQIGSFNEIVKLKSKYLGSINLSTSENTQFPITNDWHDYLSYGLYLYLPYAGIYALNPEKYLHTDIKLKVMFDVRTGTLKYYVFADDKCEDMFEGVCRISCPISGSDKRAAADMYKSGIGTAITGGVKVLAGIGAAVGGLAAAGASIAATGGIAAPAAIAMAGGIISGISGGTDIGKGTKQMGAPIPMTVSGGFSGSSNIFDDTSAKLIQVYQPYIDDGITNNLGKPDNKYQSFASISGYIEARNVKLISSQTVVRQEMLKQCLAEGCIL